MRIHRPWTFARRALGPGALFCFLAIPGCESAIPRIDPRSAYFAGHTGEELATLERGRSEYIAKCSGCHRLYHPFHGDAAYWELWVGDMARRSHLSATERDRIQGYLMVASQPRRRASWAGSDLPKDHSSSSTASTTSP